MFILICFVTLIFWSCDFEWLATNKETIFRVYNNSAQTIVVTAEHILPDTLLPKKTNLLETIKINQNRIIYSSEVEGNGDFRRMKNGDRLTLFVLSKDSVDKHSWEYLRENNVILKRYEFNWKELQMMGGNVNFP